MSRAETKAPRSPNPPSVWPLRVGGLDPEAVAFAEGARERRVEEAFAAAREPVPRGEVLRVVPIDTFTFDNPAGATQEVPLTDVVSGAEWRSGVLVVRVHGRTPFPVSSELQVLLQSASRDPMNPSVLLVDPTAIATVVVADDTPAGTLLLGASTVPFPDSFRLCLQWLQSDSGAATVTLGVDLVVRR